MKVSGICCKPSNLIVKPEYKVVRTRLLDLGLPREEVLCSFEGVIHLDGAGVGISSFLEWPRDSLHTRKIQIAKISVADPDPHVYRPHGSGSISQRYGSGSGSFYHQAIIVKKP